MFAVATSPVALRWLCDSPRMGCAWRTTPYIHVARTNNNRVIMACELCCCLLPQCEALRICRSGFPIATLRKPQDSRPCYNRTAALITISGRRRAQIATRKNRLLQSEQQQRHAKVQPRQLSKQHSTETDRQQARRAAPRANRTKHRGISLQLWKTTRFVGERSDGAGDDCATFPSASLWCGNRRMFLCRPYPSQYCPVRPGGESRLRWMAWPSAIRFQTLVQNNTIDFNHWLKASEDQ